MSGAACKAALCVGCLESILDRQTREDMNVALELIAGDQLDVKQLGQLIEVGNDLQKGIRQQQAIRADSRKVQKKFERQARARVRLILLGES